MNNLINKDTITSLELLEEINFFRKQEDRTETSHYDLLKIIRLEFDEEIGEGKISCTSTYKDSQGKDRPMFILTISQAKQVLVRESKYVRKAIIKKLEQLENKLKETSLHSYMIDDPIKRAEKWIEEQKQTKLLLEQKDNKIETQHKLIDTMTESYDGTYIRTICVDYVNKVSSQTGIHQSDLYSKVYKLVGRTLKKDLTIQFENFIYNEKLKVKNNMEYNRDNKLKGLDRKSPYLIKDSKANISKIEFVCDVLSQGNVMLESMSKVFEVGIEDIIEKYNIVKMEKELSLN